jgi:multidrug efflux pump subunit AcrA (membrane-fusion protein)
MISNQSLLLAPGELIRCATGDKLRAELAATTAELQRALAEKQRAEADGEAARLQLGTVKQQLAKSAVEAQEARGNVEEMKGRVNKLNNNFMHTSEWRCACHACLPACCCCCCCPGLAGEMHACMLMVLGHSVSGAAQCVVCCKAKLRDRPCPTHLALLPAADKLRNELTSTQSELTSAKAAKAAAEEALMVESEALRLKLGGMKQQMALNAAELEKQTETAAAMKERVMKLNTNFMQTSEWHLTLT